MDYLDSSRMDQDRTRNCAHKGPSLPNIAAPVAQRELRTGHRAIH